MRNRRAAIVVLAVLMLSLLIARPAAAGGPTSVLLSAPGSGRTASLHVGDTDYTTLATLIGAFEDKGGTADESGAREQGDYITMTWLIHDVTVWRVDRVYLDAPGGPWVGTQTDTTGRGIVDGPVSWSKVTDSAKLTALLDRLGVGPGAKSRAQSPAPASAVAAPPQNAGTVTSPTPTPTPTDGRVWGLAGLVLGAALTLAGFGASRRVRGRTGTTSRTPTLTAPTT